MNQQLIRSKYQSIMLKQVPNAVLPAHCLPNRGSDQSRRQTKIITTAPCVRAERKKRVNVGKWNKKDPVRWPRLNDQAKWNTLENSVFLQLPTYGPIAKKIMMLETILYGEAFNFAL